MTPEEAETLAAAMAAINQVQGVADSVAPPEPSPMAGANAQSFEAPEFGSDSSSGPKEGIDLLSDVHLNVRIELGRTKMYVEDVLKLSDGAVVELDKLAGDAVDVYVNDRLVAKGEVLVLNDMFCVRVSEIVDITSVEV
ncbi:flagellar motor switch protein FliN [bacterium]|nr:MAG: flagellar motor switch protein FliN [bacterium]